MSLVQYDKKTSGFTRLPSIWVPKRLMFKKNTKKSQLNKPHEPRWKSWSDTKKSPEFEQESAPLHWHWHESGICFRPFIGAVADSLLDHFGIWNSHPSQPVLFRQCLRLFWTHRFSRNITSLPFLSSQFVQSQERHSHSAHLSPRVIDASRLSFSESVS